MANLARVAVFVLHDWLKARRSFTLRLRVSPIVVPLVVAALLAVPPLVGAQSTRAETRAVSIVGAWRIVSRTYNGPDSIYTDRQREPGYYLFVADHYAFVAPAGEALRPKDQGTDAHRVALYNTFGAQAGTYALRGDRLTLRTYAAKNPGNVGMSVTWRVSVRDDTLTLESERAYKRATRNHARYMLVRARDETVEGQSRSDNEHIVADIGRLRKVLPDAWIRGDLVALDTLIADDYISISGQGFVTKRQSFAPIANGTRRILSLNYDSVKVRAFGDVAVETGWVQGDAVSGGVVQVGKGGRYTLVFVRRNGRWQLASHQYTANQNSVPPPANKESPRGP